MKKIIFRNLTNVKFQQLKNAISKDKLRPHLLGVFLDVKNEKIVVTNSHVLVAYDIDIMQEDEGMKEVLIDPKLFNQTNWLSVPKDDLDLVEFHAFEDRTEVRLGEDVVAVAKNLDAESSFPQWKHVTTDHENRSEFMADVSVLKQLLLSIPPTFGYPKFNVGKKLMFGIERDMEEDGIVKIIGLAMTYGFNEDAITDEAEEIKIERDDKGKVYPNFFKKVEGKKLARRVLNSWIEDFVDENTSEVISIERNEIVVDKNTVITPEVFDVIIAEPNVDYLFVFKYQ